MVQTMVGMVRPIALRSHTNSAAKQYVQQRSKVILKLSYSTSYVSATICDHQTFNIPLSRRHREPQPLVPPLLLVFHASFALLVTVNEKEV